MSKSNGRLSGFAVIVSATFAAATPGQLLAQPTDAQAIQVGKTDLGGVVKGASGPEAGVWVIAETTDLPTNARCEIQRLGARLRAGRFG
jgi:hypothetical protein